MTSAAASPEAEHAVLVQSDLLANAPLARTTLRGEAARRLRSEIISGQLLPATLYPIADVAQRLGVSITPVREALLELASDGLIEIVRNRGFRIIEITAADLDQIVEVRLMLEVPSVQRLAGKISPEDMAHLRLVAAETDRAAAAGDLTTYLQLDRAFHLALLGLTGNARLVEVVAKLRDTTRLYGLGRLVGTQALVDTTHEHVLLLDALEKKSGRDATKILTSHIKHTRGIWSGRQDAATSGA